MIGWIVKRYAEGYGYRKVPPRDVWAIWVEWCDPANLTKYGHKRRSQAFIARDLAVRANDALDNYEKFSAHMERTR